MEPTEDTVEQDSLAASGGPGVPAEPGGEGAGAAPPASAAASRPPAAPAAEGGHAESPTQEAPSAPSDSAALQAQLAAVRVERDSLNDRLLRTAADLDNFRKRARREVDEARLRGKDDAVRELLPVFDNLERAVRASGSVGAEAVVDGVRMVLKLFEDTAQRMGLNRVTAIGKRFDPAVHEALQQRETDEVPPGTIVEEIAAGYMFGQRLLRAAMVIVAKEPKPAAPPPQDANQTKDARAAQAGGEPAGDVPIDDPAEAPDNGGGEGEVQP